MKYCATCILQCYHYKKMCDPHLFKYETLMSLEDTYSRPIFIVTFDNDSIKHYN